MTTTPKPVTKIHAAGRRVWRPLLDELAELRAKRAERSALEAALPQNAYVVGNDLRAYPVDETGEPSAAMRTVLSQTRESWNSLRQAC